MLRAMRVEEAQPLLDKYVDDAYAAGIGQARIVHGRGTGALRKAVWEFLRGNFVSNRVWDNYEAILDACQDAWNKLMRLPERIASMTRRAWAKTVTG